MRIYAEGCALLTFAPSGRAPSGHALSGRVLSG